MSDEVDENEIPAWLTEDLIQNSLRKYFKNDSIMVTVIKVMYCGGKGESFASTMYRRRFRKMNRRSKSWE